MKFSSTTILNKIENINKNFYPILFYGNEWGLITELIKSIHNNVKNKLDVSEIKYFDNKNENIHLLKHLLIDSSLFSKINFVVIKNPQKTIIKELENFNQFENILIINGENLQAKSDIKLFFENHKNFISVPCYQLNKSVIKKTIDEFIRKHEISLENEAYWFLIENISEDYLSLHNELRKLQNFKKSSVTFPEMQKLIFQKYNTSVDNYFFNCASGNKNIILQEMRRNNKSINESYEILISIKKFINILSGAIVNKNNNNLDDLVKKYLPKYLFLKKEIFRETLSKNNINKIAKINKMLQKTEYLIRINSEQHKEILERFLLNLSKTIR